MASFALLKSDMKLTGINTKMRTDRLVRNRIILIYDLDDGIDDRYNDLNYLL